MSFDCFNKFEDKKPEYNTMLIIYERKYNLFSGGMFCEYNNKNYLKIFNDIEYRPKEIFDFDDILWKYSDINLMRG